MPASEKDVEMARRLFGCEGDITEYIVNIEIGVRNTTRAEADAIHRGQVGDGVRVPQWMRGDLSQGKGAERRADRHEVQPE